MTTTRDVESGDHDEWLPLFRGYLDFNEITLSSELAELAFDRLVDPNVDLHGAIAWDEGNGALGLIHWTTQLSTRSRLRHCNLDSLFVSPGVRGSGAGSALISHVRAWADRNHCAGVVWMTRADNAGARAVYDRFAEPSMFAQYAIGR